MSSAELRAVLSSKYCLAMMSYSRSMMSFVPPCSNLEIILGPSVTSQGRFEIIGGHN